MLRLFLGLLDLALVNAFIVHREHYRRIGIRDLTHAEFLTTLHAQLLCVKQGDLRDTVEVSRRQRLRHTEF